jgi:hypothetical protein
MALIYWVVSWRRSQGGVDDLVCNRYGRFEKKREEGAASYVRLLAGLAVGLGVGFA